MHLEALAGVAVSPAPDAQRKCVVKREEQSLGHVLTIIREISDQCLWVTADLTQTLES